MKPFRALLLGGLMSVAANTFAQSRDSEVKPVRVALVKMPTSANEMYPTLRAGPTIWKKAESESCSSSKASR